MGGAATHGGGRRRPLNRQRRVAAAARPDRFHGPEDEGRARPARLEAEGEREAAYRQLATAPNARIGSIAGIAELGKEALGKQQVDTAGAVIGANGMVLEVRPVD